MSAFNFWRRRSTRFSLPTATRLPSGTTSVTVPRDATAPVVFTTALTAIPMRNGVSTGFDVVLDTRNETIGATTILLGFPPELVNGITWQGATAGTIIGFDKGFNMLRINVTEANGLQGIVTLARVTVTSGAPETFVLNREVVVTPLEMITLALQDIVARSSGVNIPIIP